MLSINGLLKKKGKTALLRDICLTAEAGTITLITGPAQSGKSLLLQLIAGREKRDLGVITLHGQDIAKKRGVLLIAKPLKTPLSEKDLRNVNLLLLDEPFAGLDACAREERLMQLHTLTEKGVTILLAAADPACLLFHAQQVLLLRDGRTEQLSAPESLYLHPVSLFAARYLGLCNTLQGTVTGTTPKGLRAAVDADGITLECPCTLHTEAGDPAMVCIRAEHLHAAASPVPFGQNLSGTITQNTYMQGIQEVHVLLSSGKMMISRRQQETPVKLVQGQRAFLYWDSDKALLF